MFGTIFLMWSFLHVTHAAQRLQVVFRIFSPPRTERALRALGVERTSLLYLWTGPWDDGGENDLVAPAIPRTAPSERPIQNGSLPLFCPQRFATSETDLC